MKRETLKRGDKVEWASHGASVPGVIVKTLTHECEIDGHHVAASPANPEYLVRSDHSGNVAAHKAAALRKR